MQDLRDLECLIALARHRHFARAAEQCGLSQPAFSMRIRNLEERLNTRIVKRGNRFQGLTANGEKVLDHAKAILGQVRALEQEIRGSTGDIVGSLTIGVVPTAGAFAASVGQRLAAQHPGIELRLETATSLAIQQGVDDGRFDVGMTYTEGVSVAFLNALPLYDEGYLLLLPDELASGRGEAITWRDAAELPLILLEQGMQNRRIIDQVFDGIGVRPRVIAETNEFMAAVLLASQGMGATVIPDVLREAAARFGQTRALPLTEPIVHKSVCLVSRRHETDVPAVAALKALLAEAS